MNYELTIVELGKVLKKIEEKHQLNLLIKAVQSGGWLTLKGEAEILDAPKEEVSGCASKFNNIISVKIKNEDFDGAVFKITGAKGKKFKVMLDSAKYKALAKNSIALNTIKTNENECTLKVDDNMVFTIKAKAEEIKKFF